MRRHGSAVTAVTLLALASVGACTRTQQHDEPATTTSQRWGLSFTCDPPGSLGAPAGADPHVIHYAAFTSNPTTVTVVYVPDRTTFAVLGMSLKVVDVAAESIGRTPGQTRPDPGSYRVRLPVRTDGKPFPATIPPLPAGRYNLFGIVRYAQSHKCGGRPNIVSTQFGSLTVR